METILQVSWINSKDIIEYEIRQSELDGIHIEEFRLLWEELKLKNPSSVELKDFVTKLYKYINDVKPNYYINKRLEDLAFINDLQSKNYDYDFHLNDEELYDKILGGWLGRCSGCLLGKPIEKYDRNIIKEILVNSNQWPLKDYISGINVPNNLKEKYPWNKHSGYESLIENLKCMTEDDDINYAMLNLAIAESSNDINPKTDEIAKFWLEYIPVMSTFTAERVAYRNLLDLMEIEQVPLYQNPYREWIGALIRADVWGWISPGNPKNAARRAFIDASLTHLGNGVWGEVFIAVLISLSFAVKDERQLINESLKFIPANSDVYKTIKHTMAIVDLEADWENIIDLLHSKYNNFHWVHIMNNIALIAAIILYWKKDFDNAICSTVMAGWDTDSSGATVGSIIGTLIGASNLPNKWINPLNNNIRSSMKGFDNSKIDELAARTIKVINKNKENTN